MINSYRDYLDYLEADRLSTRRELGWRPVWRDKIWRFQCALRRAEFLTNCHPGSFIARWSRFRLRALGDRLGFSIPLNVFGPGLSIAHIGTIVVNEGARIGPNCRIHVDVVIGTKAGKEREAPTIGANCYIGPGAKIFGPIFIGDNVAIGANAVVMDSFVDGNATLAGVPARKVSNKTSDGLLVQGWRK